MSMAVSALLAIPSQATMHSMSDPVFGTDSVTLDDVTQLQWLDVPLSANISYNDIITEFGSGGSFEGWRHATLAEADAFATNAGITINIGSTVANFVPASNLIALIGTTAGTQALGFVGEPAPDPGLRVVYSVATQDGLTGSAALAFHEYDDVPSPALGHYLVRAPVEVPSSSFWTTIGLGLLMATTACWAILRRGTLKLGVLGTPRRL